MRMNFVSIIVGFVYFFFFYFLVVLIASNICPVLIALTFPPLGAIYSYLHRNKENDTKIVKLLFLFGIIITIFYSILFLILLSSVWVLKMDNFLRIIIIGTIGISLILLGNFMSHRSKNSNKGACLISIILSLAPIIIVPTGLFILASIFALLSSAFTFFASIGDGKNGEIK